MIAYNVKCKRRDILGLVRRESNNCVRAKREWESLAFYFSSQCRFFISARKRARLSSSPPSSPPTGRQMHWGRYDFSFLDFLSYCCSCLFMTDGDYYYYYSRDGGAIFANWQKYVKVMFRLIFSLSVYCFHPLCVCFGWYMVDCAIRNHRASQRDTRVSNSFSQCATRRTTFVRTFPLQRYVKFSASSQSCATRACFHLTTFWIMRIFPTAD